MTCFDNQDRPIVEGFTIDGPHSRDLDDAIWLEIRDQEHFVRVCIAEVATAVELDSSLDLHARARGFTRYFAESNAPMLPRSLSEDQRSLLPDVRRPVVCVEMRLDPELNCTEVAIRPAILESAAQLTYAQAAALSQGQSAPEYQDTLMPMLKAFASLCKRLLEKRRQQGALALYDLRAGWTVSEEGQIKRLSLDEANIGYVIIQEMMVLTNWTVAETLLRANVPTLFRNHEASVAVPERASLLHRIESTFAHPEHLNLQTLQQNLQLVLSRARYGPSLIGHYGLNLPAYLHFTSPLRRYADLVNQRIVYAYVSQQPPPYTTEELKAIGDELNQLVDAEALKKNEYFRKRKEEETERNLYAEAHRIAALPDKDVYRVVVRAAQEPEPAEELLLGLEQRLTSNRVSLKELFGILFESPANSETWQALRSQALSWLEQHPEHALSLLAMGAGLRDWPAPRYAFSGSGTAFSVHATLRIAGGEYLSGIWYGTNKRLAQQKAALALCHLLCGSKLPEQPAPPPPVLDTKKLPEQPAPLPSSLETVKPPEQPATKLLKSQAQVATPAPVLATLSETDIASVKELIESFDWSVLETEIQSGNYVSALYHLCQKTHHKQPHFVIVQTHFPVLCRLTLKWKEGTLQTEGTGKNGQEARQNAAQAFLNALMPSNFW